MAPAAKREQMSVADSGGGKGGNADGSGRSRKGQNEGPLQRPRQIKQAREEITQASLPKKKKDLTDHRGSPPAKGLGQCKLAS
jgi:hypothetical protein